MNEEIIVKSFAIDAKGAALRENMLSGSASVMGHMDRGNDVIYPGAYKGAIKEFLKSGFVSVGHDWTDYAAMPTVCKEDGRDLYVECEFHTTDDAQRIRTKCKERIEKGLSVGLSVAFYSSGQGWFENGKLLLDDAKAKGCDMALFDASIKKHEGVCRGIWEVSELFEYGIVPVPMNKLSTATAVKQFDFSEARGASFEDHARSVLGAVEGLIERAQDIKTLRDAKGANFSDERRNDLERIHSKIAELLSVIPKDVGLDLLRESVAMEFAGIQLGA